MQHRHATNAMAANEAIICIHRKRCCFLLPPLAIGMFLGSLRWSDRRSRGLNEALDRDAERKFAESRESEYLGAKSCERNGKWITSFAAMVAPHTCDLVRGAPVFKHPRVPLHQFFPSVELFLFFLLLPLPQNRVALYCLSLIMSFSVQNLSRVPAITRAVGLGICFSRIHL